MKKSERVAPTPLTESDIEAENDLGKADDYSIMVAFNRMRAELNGAIANLQALKKNIFGK